MSDSGEVLKKADALLSRYGRGTPPEAEDDFPVLTEIVEPGGLADASLPPQPREAVRISGFTEEQRQELAIRITEQVHQAIASRLSEVLAEPLRERLIVCLCAAVDSAAAQIRDDVETMVQAAVVQAIERVRDELREPAPRRSG